MKTEKIKTDNLSFGLYLSKIDHNALVEHVRAKMRSEAIIKVILENEYLQNDCITIIFKKEISLPKKFKKSMLKEELSAADDKMIIDYMCLLFSKKEIINMILKYTDELTRIDIIKRQNLWNKTFIQLLNYN
jgi:hypothetical protein